MVSNYLILTAFDYSRLRLIEPPRDQVVLTRLSENIVDQTVIMSYKS